MVHAYYMDSSTDDCRLPHQLSPPQPCALEHLAKLGVLYWHMPAAADAPDTDETLKQLRLERGYSYEDKITITEVRACGAVRGLGAAAGQRVGGGPALFFILRGGALQFPRLPRV